MKLSDYAQKIGVTYKIAYRFECAGLVDNLVAVILCGQRRAKRKTERVTRELELQEIDNDATG